MAELRRNPVLRALLAAPAQLADHLAAHGDDDAYRFRDGGVQLRPYQVLRQLDAVELPDARPAVSGRDRGAAAVHQGTRSRAARYLFWRCAAAGGLQPGHERAAAAAFFQGHSL